MHFPVVNRIECVSQASDMDRIVALMQGISASSTSTPSSPWTIEGLTTYQIYFKASWPIQEKAHINGLRQYITDVETWTCTCGRQKYDRHHICKHLIQAVPHPPLKFWRKVIRRRVIPIYRHPALVRKADNDGPGPATSYVDPDDGSITDGDDHLHLGNPGVFAW